MTGGRPLRFLAVLLSGWAMARGIAIYNGSPLDLPRWIEPVTRAVTRAVASLGSAPAAATPLPVTPPIPRGNGARAVEMPTAQADPRATPPAASPPWTTIPPVSLPRTDPPQQPAAPLLPAPVMRPPPIAQAESRLAGSAWLIARNGAAPGVPGSQLGASQAGARLTYTLGTGRHLALAGRVSAPLSGRGKEAAVGLDWQPTRAPVHVVAEQRLALDGGRGGAMLGIVGGFGPVAVARGLRLEGYGQAGVIARNKGEGFADGALRAAHPLPAIGALRADIGAGIWGGVQRGAARLDIGPSLGVVVPMGRGAVRVTADWRQRIGGTSRPGSGPALSIGTNF